MSMDEDELKRLVSEGQIRAFRDENRMKFRKEDISALKKGKQTFLKALQAVQNFSHIFL